uniref:Ribonuclease H-like domain-containing protein n=1 Tax=Tanacetum cinerariifolium TaxID=118510 RepID=A0A6L2LI03_TANCI|nr:ribonuclease H-like domain-containing protein [Tanacetum cinerariifolium]
MSSFYESPQCHLNIYLCQICESNSHYGYECSQRVSLVYEPEPCYPQNISDNDYSHDLPSVNPLIDHHCCHECRNSLNDFFCHQCTCEFCGNGAHVGYNCPAQVPYFQTLPSFLQQYPCCEDCGVTHEAYQCQPMNEDYYHEQNSCYDSNSIGFDHCQPPQYTVNHPIFNAHNDFLNSQNELMKQMTSLTSMCEMACQIIQKNQKEKKIKEEQADNGRYWKIPACCDDDDDYNFSITPNEPVDSLSMGDEHLNTIPATESDEFIKSSVETLVSKPSESEGENGCDVLACFTTFLNVLFDADYDFYSVDDQSFFDEDLPKGIHLNPLFDEEIIPKKIDPHPLVSSAKLVRVILGRDRHYLFNTFLLDIMEDVLHSFVAENEPIQQLAYKDFKQAGRKINFNNKDSARFDRRKARCNNCLQLGHFARECNVKKVDEKARYSAFKISETKEAEQVYGLMAGFESDFTVHAGNVVGVQAHKNTVKTLELQKDWYHQTQLALEEKVRILSANLENTTNTLKYSKTLYAQAKIKKQEWEFKFVESLARFDKWQESSKNLAKLLYSSMSTRTKLVLGFKEYIGSNEVCDLSIPSVFDPKPENKEIKSLYERFVKAGKMHEVPPPTTGTFMPTSYQSDLAETQATFGSKSNTSSINTSESNDFVSFDNSDKSSASETYDFASCVSIPKTNDSFSTVDVMLLPKSDVKDPSLTNGLPSCSFKENLIPLRNLCNKSETAERMPCKNNFARIKKCFVCGSKSHLIKDCNVYDTVDNLPSVVLKVASIPAGSRNSSPSTSAGRSIPAASRNRSASIHVGQSIPAASRNRPASIHAGTRIHAGRINKLAPFLAGSSVPTGWTNPAAKSFFGPTNLYFDNVYWPGIYDYMSMNEGRWGSAVKSSVHPHVNKDIGIVDSGCSRSMTINKDKLDDFVQVKGGTVTFGGGDVLSKEFQLPDESQVVLRIPIMHDLYTFNLSDIQPEQHINCLLAKASFEESIKWHRRMAHVNFKTINKLAKHGLVDGLPLKLFTNEHNCVACNKGKQHKASYKAISAVRTISEPL